MYQALYRKYRSQTFDEMVGQEVIAKTLKQAVATGKISHAYLFSGPRGTGKTSAAKIFAKAMNCPNQVDGEPCNACDLCQDITRGALEDVIEIDAASNNGVDEIRDIRDKSTYAPSRAKYKVYIIDEVHMLSTGAFNALLKTLEEPTDNVVFILATTELHKIPATILSRVQRFEFKSIKPAAIREHLAHVLDQEQITYDEQALAIIAKQAQGGMRDALSILDQALSLSDGTQLTTSVVEDITGTIALTALSAYFGAIAEQDSLSALTHLQTIFDSGKSMGRFATDLLTYMRDLLIAQHGGEVDGLGDQAHLALPAEQLFTMIDIVTRSLSEIKSGSHPKLYAEMMTIKLANPAQETTLPDDVAQQLSSLKHQLTELKTLLASLQQQPSSSAISQKKAAPIKNAYKLDKRKVLEIMAETVQEAQQSRAYLDALKGAWNEILDSISPQDRALLLGSEPVLANAENALLAFETAFSAEQVMKRGDLNTIFGNIMSQAAGFSPNIMAVTKADFQLLRTEFARQHRSNDQPAEEVPQEAPVVPEAFQFLAEKIEWVDD
ncbi:DNA polymerase III subunit gamma/tau [Streptococcus entericus]|uniref:DNA polymerase III subunit gamma/tau n=1 Tax=Streptococcus entericus TaxID=155680 RepID=UPI0003656BEE|nr:DNA polymerase III subunit gamma/tau [Streptococcus entericus]